MHQCTNCEKTYSKWQGKCDSCGEWNTLLEVKSSKTQKLKKNKPSSISPVNLSDIKTSKEKTLLSTGISEFDNTLGGGILSGQVILLAGEPGVGKSTLSLHVLQELGNSKQKTLYIAGEESPEQIKHRADRLTLDQKHTDFVQETNIEAIEQYITANISNYSLVLVDSIQTLYSGNSTSSTGSVSQVSECTDKLVNLAKGYGIPIVIIGHVTKSGNIAGPKILEHMVDTVLYFEGDKKYEYRLLRVEKNRYGSTDEVGLFKMDEEGLKEIKDAKELFDSNKQPAIGSVFSIALEGNRPIVIEVQALATKSYFEIPRRTTSGFDKSRLHILLALADKLLKLKTYQYDVYVNITGGFTIKDPALDVAVLKALISSIKNTPVNPQSVYFGEIGLTGEIRKVFLQDKRLKEAKRLGFKEVVSHENTKKVNDLM